MKFSIIIPVYNVAPYLRECLDSVFAAAKMLDKKNRENVEAPWFLPISTSARVLFYLPAWLKIKGLHR